MVPLYLLRKWRMSSIEDILGIDLTNKIDLLAKDLVDDLYDSHDELVRIRQESGLTVEEVAWRIGCHVDSVLDFEAYYGMDSARRGFINRYALSTGARISTKVEVAFDPKER